MNSILAQAVPSLWIIPFGLAYALGIPIGAFVSVLLNIALRLLPRVPFLAPTFVSIVIPLVGLVSMEIIKGDNRAFYHRTLLDDAKTNLSYWAMTLFALILGAIALCRRSRISDGLPQKTPLP
jgi:hypothetical protein